MKQLLSLIHIQMCIRDRLKTGIPKQAHRLYGREPRFTLFIAPLHRMRASIRFYIFRNNIFLSFTVSYFKYSVFKTCVIQNGIVVKPVSYTHLDVYKRQRLECVSGTHSNITCEVSCSHPKLSSARSTIETVNNTLITTNTNVKCQQSDNTEISWM